MITTKVGESKDNDQELIWPKVLLVKHFMTLELLVATALEG